MIIFGDPKVDDVITRQLIIFKYHNIFSSQLGTCKFNRKKQYATKSFIKGHINKTDKTHVILWLVECILWSF